jgi:hypothetical protein
MADSYHEETPFGAMCADALDCLELILPKISKSVFFTAEIDGTIPKIRYFNTNPLMALANIVVATVECCMRCY